MIHKEAMVKIVTTKKFIEQTFKHGLKLEKIIIKLPCKAYYYKIIKFIIIVYQVVMMYFINL